MDQKTDLHKVQANSSGDVMQVNLTTFILHKHIMYV